MTLNGSRIGKWIAGGLGALVLLVALLLYTPPGLTLVGRMVSPLSGGMVRVDGLGGFFPNQLHAAWLEIADSGGVWLQIEQPSLRWSAFSFVSNHIAVREVSAARITVLRRPIPSGAAGTETPQLDIEELSFPRITLASPVIGHAIGLSASGALHYTSIHQLGAGLLIMRAGNSDSYRISGSIVSDVARGSVTIREGADGILGKLAGLPGLGPVNLTALADGNANANRMLLTLSAGALQAQGRGTILLATQRADIDLTLAAPAMTPSRDIAWKNLSGEAHFHGRFDSPVLRAQLQLTDGRFDGLAAKRVALDVTGYTGSVELAGSAYTLRLPGDYPGLFAGSPVRFQARADLKAVGRPVTFAVLHPLANLHGVVQTRSGMSASADLAIPSLAPFAALGKIKLRGNAGLHIALAMAGQQMTVVLNGKLDTQGTAIPAKLLGRNATLSMNAILEGNDLTQSRFRLHGAAIATDMEGSLRKNVLNYRLSVDIGDLSRMVPTLQGTLSMRGRANGQMGQAKLSVTGGASLATRGFARQRVSLDVQADGLPGLHAGRLAMYGRLDGAPLVLRAALKGGRTRQANFTARWRSLDAKANIAIGENSALSGKAALGLRQLADVTVFTGGTVTGAANAAVTFKPRGGKTDTLLQAKIRDLHLDAAATAKLVSFHGAVGDVMGKPVVALVADIQGLAIQDFNGVAQAKLDGPLDRLMIISSAGLEDGNGGPMKANVAASLNLTEKLLSLRTLDGYWRGVALKLDAPATIEFADGLEIDRFTAHLGSGTLTAAGGILPRLALTASARGIAVGDFKFFLPQLGAQGTLSASANLSGTIAAPQGTISVQGRDLRAAFSSRTKSSAAFDARAQLAGAHATVTASMTEGGNARLTLDGTVPLNSTGIMALHADGNADLTLLDPFLAVAGRRMRGTLAFDASIGGTPAAPRISGRGKLANGEIQDYARGFRLNDIAATVAADGTRIRLTQLTGRAGQGTISGSGSIDLAAPNMPVDMIVAMKDARPIASDLVTANLSGNVKLTGHIRTLTTLSGQVQVTGGEINLPENFPPEVAVLNVRRRGQPLPPPALAGRMALDIAMDTTGSIFVRGHGMEADMGGSIRVGGTTATPLIDGGFLMNRGSYSVAGQTLNFTTGRVRFDGVGVRGRLDPTLEFAAQTVSGGVTATLAVGGYASAPKVTLSSSPPLPQDEVVAHLLFQQSVKQLTPLQLASIAQAVAAMGGIGGGFSPLGAVRRTLGLDRLSVGSANGGATGTQSQTTVEAGRYVARNVYVGVKQNLSGGTQTQVQVDITRRLKAQATLSAGSTAVTTQGNAPQDNGSSVGLSYQFEY